MGYAEKWMVKFRMALIRAQGIADSGTTTTLVDSDRTEPDDSWKGYWLTIIEGTNRGHERKITGWVFATRTLTVSPAFPVAIDSTSKYVISGEERDREIESAIAYADGWIDSRVSEEGGVTEVTQILKEASADLATYYMMRTVEPQRATLFKEDGEKLLEQYVTEKFKRLGITKTEQDRM